MSKLEKNEADDFTVDDKTARKIQGKKRRKQKKIYDKQSSERRIGKVGRKKKWHFDHNKYYTYDDNETESEHITWDKSVGHPF